MLQNNNDLYCAIQDIAANLEQNGSTRAAADLRDALSISTLPGEIFGEARLALRRVRQVEANLDTSVRTRIDEAIVYIDRVLGP